MMIERYDRETGRVEEYKKVFLVEDVTIKKEIFYKVEHEYYERIFDGELFEPFENPDKNIEKDYALYRKRFSLLSPKEVKSIREKYNLTVREFAAILGFSYANLSAIENGNIQASYIDNGLRLAADPYAFLQLVEGKKEITQEKLTVSKYDALINLLHDYVVHSYKEHEDIAKQIREAAVENVNLLKRLTNVSQLDFPSNKTNQQSEVEQKWTVLDQLQSKAVNLIF
ncbi:MAG: helix-turn-helix domain-containing protein [Enterococcus sp.]